MSDGRIAWAGRRITSVGSRSADATAAAREAPVAVTITWRADRSASGVSVMRATRGSAVTSVTATTATGAALPAAALPGVTAATPPSGGEVDQHDVEDRRRSERSQQVRAVGRRGGDDVASVGAHRVHAIGRHAAGRQQALARHRERATRVAVGQTAVVGEVDVDARPDDLAVPGQRQHEDAATAAAGQRERGMPGCRHPRQALRRQRRCRLVCLRVGLVHLQLHGGGP